MNPLTQDLVRLRKRGRNREIDKREFVVLEHFSDFVYLGKREITIETNNTVIDRLSKHEEERK